MLGGVRVGQYLCPKLYVMGNTNKVLVFLVLAMGVSLAVVTSKYRSLNERFEVAMANVKAYQGELEDAQQSNRAFQLTIDQLEYFRDSITMELDATRKQLKVKDKELKALHYVSTGFSRVDTVTINDTIFRSPEVKVDTLISDEWYTMDMKLRYPSTVIVKPSFKSVKNIVVSSKRETVNPPKKFFLFRWFQKKHNVIKVDVVEKNPYATDQVSRYIEIVK